MTSPKGPTVFPERSHPDFPERSHPSHVDTLCISRCLTLKIGKGLPPKVPPRLQTTYSVDKLSGDNSLLRAVLASGNTAESFFPRLDMVTHKGPPALRPDTCVRPAVPMRWQICAHIAWRHAQAEREHELIGNLLLAPYWIVTGYATDECSQIRRKWRSSGCGSPPPAQAEPLAMPPDQGRRLYDDQGLSAVEPAGQ
jgi:hypothetical protein